jgi:hypothetical protein
MVRELTPFATNKIHKPAAAPPDLDGAREVKPILNFGPPPPLASANHPQGVDLRAVALTAVETKAEESPDPADDDDPKADATSSATSSASLSEPGSSESGTPNQNESSTILHPSTLPVNPEKIASAVKALNEEPPPFLLP